MLPLIYNLRSLFVKKYISASICISVCLTTAVFVGLLSIIGGFNKTLKASGNPDNVLVLSKSFLTPTESHIPPEIVNKIKIMPGIALKKDIPLVSEEYLKGAFVTFHHRRHFVMLRGVTNIAFTVHNEIKTSPLALPLRDHKILVGILAKTLFRGLKVGDTLSFGHRKWEVAGFFNSHGEMYDGEIWTQLRPMMLAFNQNDISFLTIRVKNPLKINQFINNVNTSFSLFVRSGKVKTLLKFSETAKKPLKALISFISFLMFIGLSFGLFVSIFNYVFQRKKEIGILRALGFSKRSVMGSIILESILLTLIGGILGCLLGLFADRLSMRAAWGPVIMAFRLHATPLILAKGVLFSITIGLVVGFLGSLIAVRFTVINTIRNL